MFEKYTVTREVAIATLIQELSDLRFELTHTRRKRKQRYIMAEIRGLCKRIEALRA